MYYNDDTILKLSHPSEMPPSPKRWEEGNTNDKTQYKRKSKPKVGPDSWAKPFPWVPAKHGLEGYVITLLGAVIVNPLYLLSLENSIAVTATVENVVSEFQEGPNQDTCVPDRRSCTGGLAGRGTSSAQHMAAVSLLKMGLKDGDSLKGKLTTRLWHP